MVTSPPARSTDERGSEAPASVPPRSSSPALRSHSSPELRRLPQLAGGDARRAARLGGGSSSGGRGHAKEAASSDVAGSDVQGVPPRSTFARQISQVGQRLSQRSKSEGNPLRRGPSVSTSKLQARYEARGGIMVGATLGKPVSRVSPLPHSPCPPARQSSSPALLVQQDACARGRASSPDLRPSLAKHASRTMSLRTLRDNSVPSRTGVLPHQKPAPLGSVHPHGHVKLVWDGVLSVLILYYALIIPYRIAFLDAAHGPWRAVDWAVDAFFFADICLNFVTGVPSLAADERALSAARAQPLGGAPDDAIVAARDDISYDRRLIATRYARGWLAFDVFSTIPFDRIVQASIDGHVSTANAAWLRSAKLLRVARLFRLAKLIRLLRLNQTVVKLEERGVVPPLLLRFLKLLFAVALSGHYVACMLMMGATFATEDEGSGLGGATEPGAQHTGERTWMEIYGHDDNPKEEQYVIAMYWAFATMTTIGYGDITASLRRLDEVLVSLLAELIGIVVFSYIISTMRSLSQSFDLRLRLYREKISQVRDFMQARKIDRVVQQRVRAFYSYYYERRSVFDEGRILSEVSNALRITMAYEAHQQMLRPIPFFQQTRDKAFIAAIGSALRPFPAERRDVICYEGTVIADMYWIVQGTILCERMAVPPAPPEPPEEPPAEPAHGMACTDYTSGAEASPLNRASLASGSAPSPPASAPCQYARQLSTIESVTGQSASGGGEGRLSAADVPTAETSNSLHSQPASSVGRLGGGGARAGGPQRTTSLRQRLARLSMRSTRSADSEVANDVEAIGSLGAGEHFGDISLLLNLRQRATCIAAGHCDLLWLSRAGLEHVLMAFPRMRDDLLASIKAKRQLSIFHALQDEAVDAELERLRRERVEQRFRRRVAKLAAMKGGQGGGAGAGSEVSSVAPYGSCMAYSGLLQRGASCGGLYSVSATGSPTHLCRSFSTGATHLQRSESQAPGSGQATGFPSPAESERYPAGASAGGGAPTTSGGALLLPPSAGAAARSGPVSASDEPNTPSPYAESAKGAADAPLAVLCSESAQLGRSVSSPAPGRSARVAPMAGARAISQDGSGKSTLSASLRIEAGGGGGARLSNGGAGFGCTGQPGCVQQPLPFGGAAAVPPSRNSHYENRSGGVSRPSGLSRHASSGVAPAYTMGSLKHSRAVLSRSASCSFTPESSFGKQPSSARASCPSAVGSAGAGAGGDESSRGDLMGRPPLQKKRSMMHLSVESTHQRQLADCRARWLVHPQHPLKLGWDIFLSLLICYSALMVPYRVLMLASVQGGWLFLELAFDCVFMVDICLSLRTAYMDEGGAIVLQPGLIARNYLRTWFLIDFVSSLPYDYIISEDMSVGHGSTLSPAILQLLRMLRLVRLLKLARLLKLGRIMGKLQEEGWINPSTLELGKLIVYLMLLVHLSGCIWHFVAASSSEEQTWLRAVDTEGLPTHHLYFLSIYWALTTMSTIGYGDIVAQNQTEYCFAMVVMMLGASVFGVMIGGMTDLVDHLDPEGQRKAQRMAQIKEYLRERSFPHALQLQIVQYYTHYLNDFADIETGQVILNELPPPLRTEIMLALNQPIIEKVLFLKDRDAQFIVSVCVRLRPMFATLQEKIYTEGEVRGSPCARRDLCFHLSCRAASRPAADHSPRLRLTRASVARCADPHFAFPRAAAAALLPCPRLRAAIPVLGLQVGLEMYFVQSGELKAEVGRNPPKLFETYYDGCGPAPSRAPVAHAPCPAASRTPSRSWQLRASPRVSALPREQVSLWRALHLPCRPCARGDCHGCHLLLAFRLLEARPG